MATGLREIGPAALRVAVHSLMVRIAMPLDGVLAALEAPGIDNPAALDIAVEFMSETLQQFPPLIARLSKVAGQSFDSYERVFLPGRRPGEPPMVNPDL